MSKQPPTTAILAGSRGECQRIAAVLEESGIEVIGTALDVAELEPPAESGGDAVVFSCAGPPAEVKERAFALRRRLGRVPVVVVAPEGDFGPGVRAVLEANAEAPRSAARAVLSCRERQVLRLAVEGMTNDAIARALFISRSTVKSHLTSAFSKLSVRSRNEAALLLSNPDEPAARLVFGPTVIVPEGATEMAIAGSG